MEPITFGITNLSGNASVNPTGIAFSKTGNPTLFVAQQDGTVYRYEVERSPDGPDADDTDEFAATSSLAIEVIQDDTQNFDDDGSLNFNQKRQVTGLATTTDDNGNDVLYVSSSDWRIAVGTDSGLDTNSGQIHKITLDPDTGAVISNVAIVRGLPRSEENHANNGISLAVDPVTGDDIMYVAVGGITNKGAPGNNFAGTTDFAWSAAIIKINLTTLETYDIRTDANGNEFVVDLPTLDDPSRPNVDLSTLNIQNLNLDPNFTLDDNGNVGGVLQPDWAGGNNGLNQAKITDHVLVSENGQLTLAENPVDLFAPGYRNSYDVIALENGEVFTWDNGPNGGWGGQPLSFSDGAIVDDWTTELATNEFNETGSKGFGDQLHYLGNTSDEYGTYGGHASPLRAAKEALDAAFNSDGTYKGATPNDPITADGVQLFANEAEALDYLAKLLIIYEQDGSGSWNDVTSNTGLPSDLFDVLQDYDWKHPGSSLTDPTAFFDGTSVQDGTPFSPESQLFDDENDGSLVVTPNSTNGLTEYRATYFNGALQGAIVAASFDETLYFAMPEDTDGDGRTDAASIVHTVSLSGSNPLALDSLPDFGLSSTLIDNTGDGVDDFSGIMAVATYGADTITILVPGGTPIDPGNDLDEDGQNDIIDSHVGDPLNGLGVILNQGQSDRWDFEPNNPASTPPGAVPSGNSIAGGIGINAAFRDGVVPATSNGGDDNAGLFDDGVFNLGGASSFASIDEAHDGAAEGSANTQRDVLGIGFGAPDAERLAITTEMINIFTYSLNTDAPAKTWDGDERVGLVVGPGDQTNFAEATIATRDEGGSVKFGVQILVETNDVPQSVFVEIPGIENPVIAGLGDPNFQVAMDFDLTPGLESASARARYVDDGSYTDWVSTAALAIPQEVVDAIKGAYDNEGETSGAFVGMLATAAAGDDSFAASWDWIDVENVDDPVGAAHIGVHETDNDITKSSFAPGSFEITNTGDKRITKVEFDISSAILPDAVIDPFGLAGDTAFKELTIDSAGGTGVDQTPDASNYVGTGGADGYEGLILTFDNAVNNGFETGETVTFSIDLDPNSLLGARKALLDAGSTFGWDAAGISGAEIIGSHVTVTYEDGSTSSSQLIHSGTDAGAYTDTSQAAPGILANLSVNGVGEGGTGTYGAGGPSVVVAGPAGFTARVTLGKGFVQPVTNEFYNGNAADQAYAPQLDQQLADLAASDFPANNLVELQTFDIALDGSNQDITSMFDFNNITDYDFSGEDEVPLAFVATIINPGANNAPMGGTTAPIFLTFDPGAGDTAPPTVLSSNAPDVGPGQAGQATLDITVVFQDNVAIDVSSIDVGDLTVTGPGGALNVSSVSVDMGSNGSPRSATYTIDAPGGTWDAADDGAYTVGIAGSEVLDTSGNAVAADATLDSFTVDVSSPPPDPFRVEAESFTIDQNFNIKNNASASNGQYLQAGGSAEQRASYTFMATSGTYDLSLGYYDEDDGQSTLQVLVNGVEIDSFTWDRDTGGPLANPDTAATRAINGVSLDNGDVIELVGFKNGSEPLRVDFLDFTYTGAGGGDTTVPTVQSTNAPDIGAGEAGNATTDITITFADNVAIDVSSIDIGDINVSGPGGFLTVSSVNVDVASDGTPRTATYTVNAPGGTWDAADNGAYTIELLDSEVEDTSGNKVTANPSLDSFNVNIGGSGPDPFRVEVEDMTLTTFTVKNNASASGGQYAQAFGNGEQRASYTFTATDGTYDLELGYFDEDDGQSSMQILLNSVAIDSFVWDRDTGGALANGATFATRMLSGVELSNGDVIELVGTKDGGEPLRTDYLDFTYTGSGGGGDTLAPVVQSTSAPDVGPGQAGNATTDIVVTFGDNVAIDVSSIDVSDIVVTGPGGAVTVSSVSVDVGTDGTPRVATYTLDAPGGTWDVADEGSYTVALQGSEVLDTSGNEVAANATLATFDVNLSGPPASSFRVEAESSDVSLDLGFTVKNNNSASNGQYIQAQGSGEQRASYTFDGAAETYDLIIGHFDENDGQSTLNILLNGSQIDSFVWNQDAGGALANPDSFATYEVSNLALTSGDVIEISGFKDGSEPLRVDYFDFVFNDEPIA